MLTEFGRILRIYRVNHGITLKDMADSLFVPSSYLSSMEMGRKNISHDFLKKLFNTYQFNEEEVKALKESVANSGNVMKLDLRNSNREQRNLALEFARSFDSLNEDEIKVISDYLNRGGERK
jgi:transcriptional regulator with XRE-family HTH domain